MTSPLRTRLAAAALALAATAALAQAPAAPAAPASSAAAAPGTHHHGRHFDPAKMQERHAKRLADLKQKLQITSAQESAWTSFTTALRSNLERKRIDREAIARMSTPDRIDHLRVLREQRAAEMDRRGEATKAFYATLSAEQQKVFDAETARMGRHGGHHGPRG